MKLNSGLKQKFLRTAAAGALIAGLLPATNAFAVSAFPTSGSCSMLITMPVPVGATMPITTGYNIIAVVTFTSATTGTIDYSMTKATYNTGGYTAAAKAAGDTGTGIAVTIAPLVAPAPAAGRAMTFTPSGGTAVTMNAIAVNGGNTVLMQGDNNPFSGVCQF